MAREREESTTVREREHLGGEHTMFINTKLEQKGMGHAQARAMESRSRKEAEASARRKEIQKEVAGFIKKVG